MFYSRLGSGPASSVSAMELAMGIDVVVVLAAAALTLLLPRRPRAIAAVAAVAAVAAAAAEEPVAEVSAGAAH